MRVHPQQHIPVDVGVSRPQLVNCVPTHDADEVILLRGEEKESLCRFMVKKARASQAKRIAATQNER